MRAFLLCLFLGGSPQSNVLERKIVRGRGIKVGIVIEQTNGWKTGAYKYGFDTLSPYSI